jgi:hypothetical protein
MVATGRGDICLNSDDRLDAGTGAALVEIVGTVYIAVISHGDSRQAQPVAFSEHLLQAGRAVEHGVLRVNMQMHKGVATHEQ